MRMSEKRVTETFWSPPRPTKRGRFSHSPDAGLLDGLVDTRHPGNPIRQNSGNTFPVTGALDTKTRWYQSLPLLGVC